MNYYNAKQSMKMEGVFIGYLDGCFVFILENEDVIDFDLINPAVLQEFDLKSEKFNKQKFELHYSENFDDLDDEDIVIFKLEKLILM